jgi:hypothetical protein
MKLGLQRRLGAAVAVAMMMAATAALAGCPAEKPPSGPGDVQGATDGGTTDDAAAPAASTTVEGDQPPHQ